MKESKNTLIVYNTCQIFRDKSIMEHNNLIVANRLLSWIRGYSTKLKVVLFCDKVRIMTEYLSLSYKLPKKCIKDFSICVDWIWRKVYQQREKEILSPRSLYDNLDECRCDLVDMSQYCKV